MYMNYWNEFLRISHWLCQTFKCLLLCRIHLIRLAVIHISCVNYHFFVSSTKFVLKQLFYCNFILKLDEKRICENYKIIISFQYTMEIHVLSLDIINNFILSLHIKSRRVGKLRVSHISTDFILK
jgi:hypothetical protein